MSKAKYVGEFIDGVYQVAGGSAKSAAKKSQPAVQVAAGGSGNSGYVHSRPPSVSPRYAREDMGNPASRVQVAMPSEQMTSGPNPGVIGDPMGSNPIVPFDVSAQPPGAFPIAKYQPPPEAPMGSQLPAVIPTSQTAGRRQGVKSTEHIGKHQTFDEAYQQYIDMGGEIGEMAKHAAKGRTPIEDFLNTPYGGSVPTGTTIPGRGGLERTQPLTIMEMITGKPNVEIKSDFVINETRPGTIGDAISAVTDAPKPKSNKGSNPVSSEKAGYEGFQSGGLAMNFLERHGGAAMVGAGAGMMSEGEVSAGGAARGAMFGVMGGKAARMVTGSMKGGAVNALGKSVGSKVSGMGAEGGAANKAGQYLQETMEGFAGSKSQEAMRIATFAGAGLAGFSMGRDRNHSRGMNSGRGSRF